MPAKKRSLLGNLILEETAAPAAPLAPATSQCGPSSGPTSTSLGGFAFVHPSTDAPKSEPKPTSLGGFAFVPPSGDTPKPESKPAPTSLGGFAFVPPPAAAPKPESTSAPTSVSGIAVAPPSAVALKTESKPTPTSIGGFAFVASSADAPKPESTSAPTSISGFAFVPPSAAAPKPETKSASTSVTGFAVAPPTADAPKPESTSAPTSIGGFAFVPSSADAPKPESTSAPTSISGFAFVPPSADAPKSETRSAPTSIGGFAFRHSSADAPKPESTSAPTSLGGFAFVPPSADAPKPESKSAPTSISGFAFVPPSADAPKPESKHTPTSIGGFAFRHSSADAPKPESKPAPASATDPPPQSIPGSSFLGSIKKSAFSMQRSFFGSAPRTTEAPLSTSHASEEPPLVSGASMAETPMNSGATNTAKPGGAGAADVTASSRVISEPKPGFVPVSSLTTSGTTSHTEKPFTTSTAPNTNTTAHVRCAIGSVLAGKSVLAPKPSVAVESKPASKEKSGSESPGPAASHQLPASGDTSQRSRNPASQASELTGADETRSVSSRAVTDFATKNNNLARTADARLLDMSNTASAGTRLLAPGASSAQVPSQPMPTVLGGKSILAPNAVSAHARPSASPSDATKTGGGEPTLPPPASDSRVLAPGAIPASSEADAKSNIAPSAIEPSVLPQVPDNRAVIQSGNLLTAGPSDANTLPAPPGPGRNSILGAPTRPRTKVITAPPQQASANVGMSIHAAARGSTAAPAAMATKGILRLGGSIANEMPRQTLPENSNQAHIAGVSAPTPQSIGPPGAPCAPEGAVGENKKTTGGSRDNVSPMLAAAGPPGGSIRLSASSAQPDGCAPVLTAAVPLGDVLSVPATGAPPDPMPHAPTSVSRGGILPVPDSSSAPVTGGMLPDRAVSNAVCNPSHSPRGPPAPSAPSGPNPGLFGRRSLFGSSLQPSPPPAMPDAPPAMPSSEAPASAQAPPAKATAARARKPKKKAKEKAAAKRPLNDDQQWITKKPRRSLITMGNAASNTVDSNTACSNAVQQPAEDVAATARPLVRGRVIALNDAAPVAAQTAESTNEPLAREESTTPVNAELGDSPDRFLDDIFAAPAAFERAAPKAPATQHERKPSTKCPDVCIVVDSDSDDAPQAQHQQPAQPHPRAPPYPFQYPYQFPPHCAFPFPPMFPQQFPQQPSRRQLRQQQKQQQKQQQQSEQLENDAGKALTDKAGKNFLATDRNAENAPSQKRKKPRMRDLPSVHESGKNPYGTLWRVDASGDEDDTAIGHKRRYIREKNVVDRAPGTLKLDTTVNSCLLGTAHIMSKERVKSLYSLVLDDVCLNAADFMRRKYYRREFCRLIASEAVSFSARMEDCAKIINEQHAIASMKSPNRLRKALFEISKIIFQLGMANMRMPYPTPFRQPALVRGVTLMKHQLDALHWMVNLHAMGKHGILADDMGLGKTVMSLSLAAWLMENLGIDGPHLFIVPLSTIPGWMDTLHRFFPSFTWIVYQGTRAYRNKVCIELSSVTYNIVLTSPEIIAQDEVFQRLRFYVLVVDEGHRVKNPKSLFHQCVLRMHAKMKLLLTGTPVQNQIKELWSLLRILFPTVFHCESVFEEVFGRPFQLEVKEAERKAQYEKDQTEKERAKIVEERRLRKEEALRRKERAAARRRAKGIIDVPKPEKQPKPKKEPAKPKVKAKPKAKPQAKKVPKAKATPKKARASSDSSDGSDSEDSEEESRSRGKGKKTARRAQKADESNEDSSSSSIDENSGDSITSDEDVLRQHMGAGEDIESGENVELTEEEVKGSAMVLSGLHEAIRPFFLRRTKIDVFSTTDIPRKTEYIIRVPFSPAQGHYYREIEAQIRQMVHESKMNDGYMMSNGDRLKVMARLRQIGQHPCLTGGRRMPKGDALLTASGKMELLDRMIPKLTGATHKILIFSQYVKVLHMIEAYFAEVNLVKNKHYVCLSGAVPLMERRAMMNRFEFEEDCQIFLLTTRAGGVGLNLQAANYVILFDPDWNPQMDFQAICRAYRLGQKRPVKVFRFYGPVRSVEQYMLHRTEEKLDMARKVVDLGEFSSRVMNAALEQLTEDILKNDESALLSEKFTLPAELNKMMAGWKEEAENFNRYDDEQLGTGWEEHCNTSAGFIDHLIARGRFIDEVKLTESISGPVEDECREIFDSMKMIRREREEERRMSDEDYASETWQRALQLNEEGLLHTMYPDAKVLSGLRVVFGDAKYLTAPLGLKTSFDDDDNESLSGSVQEENEEETNASRARFGLPPMREGEFLWASTRFNEMYTEEKWVPIYRYVTHENMSVVDAKKKVENEMEAQRQAQITARMETDKIKRRAAEKLIDEEAEAAKAAQRTRAIARSAVWTKRVEALEKMGLTMYDAVQFVIEECGELMSTGMSVMDAVQVIAQASDDLVASGTPFEDQVRVQVEEKKAARAALEKEQAEKREEELEAEREERIIVAPPEKTGEEGGHKDEVGLQNGTAISSEKGGKKGGDTEVGLQDGTAVPYDITGEEGAKNKVGPEGTAVLADKTVQEGKKNVEVGRADTATLSAERTGAESESKDEVRIQNEAAVPCARTGYDGGHSNGRLHANAILSVSKDAEQLANEPELEAEEPPYANKDTKKDDDAAAADSVESGTDRENRIIVVPPGGT